MTKPEKFSVLPLRWVNPVVVGDFSILQFGGTTSSYPPLKNSGKGIIFSRLPSEFLSQADAQTEHPRGKDP